MKTKKDTISAINNRREIKQAEEALKKAQEPIVMENKDFKCNPKEVDIRKLTEENFRQIEFRVLSNLNAYTKTIHDDLVDIMRLLMITLNKLGVEDIEKALTETIQKLDKESEKLKSESKQKES